MQNSGPQACPCIRCFAAFQEDTITARQKRIWDLLVEHDCLTSQQIATLLHISGRVEQKSEATASKKARATFWMPDGAKKTPVYPEPNARRTTWNGLYMLCRRHFVHLSPNTPIEQQLFSEKLCSSLQKTPHRPARDISKRDSHEVFFIHSFLSFLFFSIRLTVLLTLLRLLSAPHNAFHVKCGCGYVNVAVCFRFPAMCLSCILFLLSLIHI